MQAPHMTARRTRPGSGVGTSETLCFTELHGGVGDVALARDLLGKDKYEVVRKHERQALVFLRFGGGADRAQCRVLKKTRIARGKTCFGVSLFLQARAGQAVLHTCDRFSHGTDDVMQQGKDTGNASQPLRP